MQCPQCGREYPDGNQFCGACGIALAPGGQPEQPAPPPAAPQPPPEAPQPPKPYVTQPQQQAPPHYAQPAQQPVYPVAAEQNTPTSRRGCWGCAIALLIIFLLLACASVIGLGWWLGWYEQLGIISSPAEELFVSGRDPWAAENILLELENKGVATEGLHVYVMPSKGGGTFAYLVADESAGYSWSGPEYDNAMEGLLVHTAMTEAAEQTPVERVAVEYRGPDGEHVAVMTAPTGELTAFAEGFITQEQLFEVMNGRTDAPSGISIGGE